MFIFKKREDFFKKRFLFPSRLRD